MEWETLFYRLLQCGLDLWDQSLLLSFGEKWIAIQTMQPKVTETQFPGFTVNYQFNVRKNISKLNKAQIKSFFFFVYREVFSETILNLFMQLKEHIKTNLFYI